MQIADSKLQIHIERGHFAENKTFKGQNIENMV